MASKVSYVVDEKSTAYASGGEEASIEGVVENVDGLSRQLSNRHVQWMSIGGTIGTALFVSIGWGLIGGGPGSLFLAFLFYSIVVGSVNNGMAEMATYMPVSSSFIRMAGKWVDPSLGFGKYTDSQHTLG